MDAMVREARQIFEHFADGEPGRAGERMATMLANTAKCLDFLARDLRHGRSVAVKVLPPELAVGLGPDRFLREAVPFDLPPAGEYATGIAFLPAEADDAAKAVATLDDIAAQEGVRVLGWRACRRRTTALLILSILTLTTAATAPVARTPAATALGVATALRWLASAKRSCASRSMRNSPRNPSWHW